MRNDNIARSLRYYRNVNHKSIDDIIAFLREHDYDVSEISLIKSYREHKEMQPAVHKLLDLPAPVTRTRRKRKPKKSNPEV